MPSNGHARGIKVGKKPGGTTFTVTLDSSMPVHQRAQAGRDAWRMQEQGLCVVVKCAQQLQDAYLAFEAGKFLVEWSTAEIAAKEAKRAANDALARPSRIIDPPRRPEREEILASLKGLYAKALGPPPITLDATPQPQPQPQPAKQPADPIDKS